MPPPPQLSVSACTPAARTPPRARCRVTLRGLVSEPSGRGRASRMPPLGDAAWGKPRISDEQSAWKAGSRIQSQEARRGRSPNPRRAGAESWVFAGEMRVSVQLAYKVPVLGPRDRRLLLAPHRFLPGGREVGAQAGQGPRPGRTSRGPHWRWGGKARSPRTLCGGSRDPWAWQEQWERTRKFELVTACGSCSPGGAGSPPGPTWRKGRDGAPLPNRWTLFVYQALPCCAFQSRSHELGSGEDRPRSRVVPGNMGRDVEVLPLSRRPTTISLKMHLCGCVPNG